MSSKFTIETIALESSDDEEEEDPLRLSPPPPPVPPPREDRSSWNPLNGVTITAINGPNTSAATARSDTVPMRRIKPIAIADVVIPRSPAPAPTFINIVEPVTILPSTNNTRETPTQNPPVISQLFKRFTDACRSVEATSDMSRALKILTKKYIACDKRFTYSKHFIRFLEGRLRDVQKENASVYNCISQVRDELKRGTVRNGANQQVAKRETSTPAPNEVIDQLSTSRNGANDRPSTSRNRVNDQPSTSSNGANDQPSTSRNGANDQPSTSRNGANDQPSTSRNGANDQPSTSRNGEKDQQSTSRTKINNKRSANTRDEDSEEEDDPEERRKLAKYNSLRRSLKEVDAMIKKLETKEVDWDDDDDSTYIQLQRYRERGVKIYDKMLKISETAHLHENQTRFRPRVSCNTQFSVVNKTVEKFVNKTGQFPDYADIRILFQRCNEENNLNLPSYRLDSLAESAFRSIGEQIQNQRKSYEWNLQNQVLESSDDPAKSDPELTAKLADNMSLGRARLQQVLTSFADQQESQKLQAEEVSGGDADSSEEDDDDEDEDNHSIGSSTAEHAAGTGDLFSALGLVTSSEPDTEEPITSFLNEKTGLVEIIGPITSLDVNNLDSLTELEESDVAVASKMEISTKAVERESLEESLSPSLLDNVSEMVGASESVNEDVQQPTVPISIPNNESKPDPDETAELEARTVSPITESRSPNAVESDDDSTLSESTPASPVISPLHPFIDTEPSLDLESLISPTIIPKIDDEENVMFVAPCSMDVPNETVITTKEETTERTLVTRTDLTDKEIVIETLPIKAQKTIPDIIDSDILEENTDPLTVNTSTPEQNNIPVIVALPHLNKSLKRKSVFVETSEPVVLNSKPKSKGPNGLKYVSKTNPIDSKLKVISGGLSKLVEAVETEGGKSVLSESNVTNTAIKTEPNVRRNGVAKPSHGVLVKRPRIIDHDVITLDSD